MADSLHANNNWALKPVTFVSQVYTLYCTVVPPTLGNLKYLGNIEPLDERLDTSFGRRMQNQGVASALSLLAAAFKTVFVPACSCCATIMMVIIAFCAVSPAA
jgi:hypothetical protein